MAVTQEDIALAAGITRKTVSRYFNNPSRIAVETRNKIENACSKLNYMPNSAARSVRNGKFNRIACFQTRKIGKDGREGIYSSQLQYINGMTNVLAKNSYSLEIAPLIQDQSKGEDRIFIPRIFSEFCADGIICLPEITVPQKILKSLLNLKRPSAWLNNADAPSGWGRFLFDEKAGARRLTEFLISKGRRRIVWFDELSQWGPHYSKTDRRQAVRDTLEKAGLPHDMELIIPLKMDAEKYCSEIFKKFPEVDAVISNIPFFFKSLEYLSEEKKRGSKFETAYFISEWLAKDYRNKGVFIVTPETRLGEMAAEYVLALINGEEKCELLEPLEPYLQIDGKFID